MYIRIISRFLFSLIFSILSNAIAWSQWKPVVLMATEIQSTQEGQFKVRLQSGITIEILSSDVSTEWSDVIESLLESESGRKQLILCNLPTDTQAAHMIRSHCVSKWPGNYRMIKYCEDQQYKALKQLIGRPMSEDHLIKIRAHCIANWPEDFQMINYCEEQQLQALEALRAKGERK